MMLGPIVIILIISLFHQSILVTKVQSLSLGLRPLPRRISSETGSPVDSKYPVFVPGSHKQKNLQNVEFRVEDPDEGTYHFGYQTADCESRLTDAYLVINSVTCQLTTVCAANTGDGRTFREEMRDSSGRVIGRYGYTDPSGISRAYEYTADSRGFRTWALDMETDTDSSTEPVTTTMQPSEIPVTVNVQTDKPLFQYNPKNLQLIGPIPRPWNDQYNDED